MEIGGAGPSVRPPEVTKPEASAPAAAPEKPSGTSHTAEATPSRDPDAFEAPKPAGPVDLSGGGTTSPNVDRPAGLGTTTQAEPARPNLEDARRDLGRTPEGQGVLADMDRMQRENGLKVDEQPLEAANGQYDPSTNTISIDPSRRPTATDYAHTLAHEVAHASQQHGINPARDGQSRPAESFNSAKEYADHMIELEARAEALGVDVLNSQGERSENRLQDIYNNAVASSSGATAEERRNDGVRAMQEAITSGQEWPGAHDRYADWWTQNIAPLRNDGAAAAGN